MKVKLDKDFLSYIINDMEENPDEWVEWGFWGKPDKANCKENNNKTQSGYSRTVKAVGNRKEEIISLHFNGELDRRTTSNAGTQTTTILVSSYFQRRKLRKAVLTLLQTKIYRLIERSNAPD